MLDSVITLHHPNPALAVGLVKPVRTGTLSWERICARLKLRLEIASDVGCHMDWHFTKAEPLRLANCFPLVQYALLAHKPKWSPLITLWGIDGD